MTHDETQQGKRNKSRTDDVNLKNGQLPPLSANNNNNTSRSSSTSNSNSNISEPNPNKSLTQF